MYSVRSIRVEWFELMTFDTKVVDSNWGIALMSFSKAFIIGLQAMLFPTFYTYLKQRSCHRRSSINILGGLPRYISHSVAERFNVDQILVVLDSIFGTADILCLF